MAPYRDGRIRGRIQGGIRRITEGRNSLSDGRQPKLLVYVKTSGKDARKRFAWLCRTLGVVATAEQALGDPLGADVAAGFADRLGITDAAARERAMPRFGSWQTAFTIVGPLAAMEQIYNDDCVADGHACLDVRIPFVGQGNGKEKIRKPLSHAEEFRRSDVRYSGQDEVDTSKPVPKVATKLCDKHLWEFRETMPGCDGKPGTNDAELPEPDGFIRR